MCIVSCTNYYKQVVCSRAHKCLEASTEPTNNYKYEPEHIQSPSSDPTLHTHALYIYVCIPGKVNSDGEYFSGKNKRIFLAHCNVRQPAHIPRLCVATCANRLFPQTYLNELIKFITIKRRRIFCICTHCRNTRLQTPQQFDANKTASVAAYECKRRVYL